jgi:hypothetical protein
LQFSRRGIFNKPVPIDLLPTYLDIVKEPMDLGTIKRRVEQGWYQPPVPPSDPVTLEVDPEFEPGPLQIHAGFVRDLQLVFTNAIAFNPAGHYIYTASQFLLTHLEEVVRKEDAKLSASHTKRAEHNCSACLQQRCPLCCQGCIRLTAPTHHCHGPCKAPVTGGRCYQTRDGTRQWCDRCYIRLRGGASPHKNGKGGGTPRNNSGGGSTPGGCGGCGGGAGGGGTPVGSSPRLGRERLDSISYPHGDNSSQEWREKAAAAVDQDGVDKVKKVGKVG